MVKLLAEHQAALGLDFDLKILNQLEPQIDPQPLLDSKNYSEPGGIRNWVPYLRHPINSFTADQLTLVQMTQIIAAGYHTDLPAIITQMLRTSLLYYDAQPTTLTWTPTDQFDQSATLQFSTDQPWHNDFKQYFDQLLHACLTTDDPNLDQMLLMETWQGFDWLPNPIILSTCWQLITTGSVRLTIPTDQVNKINADRQNRQELMKLREQLNQYPVAQDFKIIEIKASDPDWKKKLFEIGGAFDA